MSAPRVMKKCHINLHLDILLIEGLQSAKCTYYNADLSTTEVGDCGKSCKSFAWYEH